MMKTKTVNTFRVFLASSNELKHDREDFERLISRLNHHYADRGISIILDIWEYLDPAYMDERKQNEYNEYVRNCDVFVVLFYLKAGGFTMEEFAVAEEENRNRKLPLFIYFKESEHGQNEKESLELTKFKNHIELQLEHFWGTYNTTPELHLDYVLWLDSFLFGSKSELRVEKGEITLGDVAIVDMSELAFAFNNKEYQQLKKRLQWLDKNIESVRKSIEKYPEDPDFSATLSQNQIERNEILQEFERQQNALLGAAKQISELRKQQVSKKLQDAINAFKSGNLDVANSLLQELEKDGEQLIEEIETKHEQMHEYIEAQLLQIQTVMAETEKPIEKRIKRIAEIYAKADAWAKRSYYDDKKYAQLLLDYTAFLYKYAFYNQAIDVCLRQIAMSEKLYGTNSKETANSYNKIGVVYEKQGEFDKALEFHKKALDICEKVLGREHPDTATSYNNIGNVYYSNGEYDKALEFHKKTLEIREKVLGKKHPDTATSYNNIGSVYEKQGEYNKVLEYYFMALNIDEKVLGKEHPYTAIDYNNIGLVYDSQGEFNKALEFHKKALDIREKVLGKEHPDTASSYSNIGSVYDSQGEYNKALEYHKKALEIREKVLGKEHTNTATSYIDIGLVYNRQGEYGMALEFYFKALDIDEKVLGNEHPHTAATFYNIGSVYREQGDNKKALEYYEKAYAIFKVKLGGKHHKTKSVELSIETVKEKMRK